DRARRVLREAEDGPHRSREEPAVEGEPEVEDRARRLGRRPEPARYTVHDARPELPRVVDGLAALPAELRPREDAVVSAPADLAEPAVPRGDPLGVDAALGHQAAQALLVAGDLLDGAVSLPGVERRDAL